MIRTEEHRMESYNKIKDFIRNSKTFEGNEDKIKALDALFEHLETETDWLTAYCSTRYHNSYEGGLLDHSISVANYMLKFVRNFAPDIDEGEAVLVALLHDCGKYCQYKRKEPTPRQQQYGYPGSMGMNEDVPYMEHEDRSLWIITKYYPYLTEEMFCAIAQHNEPWLTNTCQFKKSKMMTALQDMDYWVCLYVDEPGE